MTKFLYQKENSWKMLEKLENPKKRKFKENPNEIKQNKQKSEKIKISWCVKSFLRKQGKTNWSWFNRKKEKTGKSFSYFPLLFYIYEIEIILLW